MSATATAPASKSKSVKFESKMSLLEARAVLLLAVRTVKMGGFTERTGKIVRDVLGAKFGTYKPSDMMEGLRADRFAPEFVRTVDAWVATWSDDVSDATKKARLAQEKGVRAFIAEKGWDKVADAIESMLAARAQQIVLEDGAGNRRVHGLVDVLDLMFGIRMTPARAAALKLIAG